MAWQVLVVEDDSSMRNYLAHSIAAHPALQLAQAVDTVAQAKQALDALGTSLHVLLVDLGLPDGSGLDVIRHALALNPTIEPLVLSMFGDDEYVFSSIQAGALGYIHKDAAPADITQTILELRAGASPISPMIARRVLATIKQPSPATRVLEQTRQAAEEAAQAAVPPSPNMLTPREQQILGLIARGFSYAEVARLENLGISTVQTHIKNIYAKLAVHGKTEAIYEATRMGWLSERR